MMNGVLAIALLAMPAVSAAQEEPIRMTAGELHTIGNRALPDTARDVAGARIEDAVFLDVLVAADGTVVDAVVLRGHAALAEANRAAVLKWRFSPQLINGVAEPFRVSAMVSSFHSRDLLDHALILALTDPNPIVRDRAVYEGACRLNPSVALQDAIVAAAADVDATVRFTARRVNKECR